MPPNGVSKKQIETMNPLKKFAAILALFFLSGSLLHAAEPALDGYCVVCYSAAGKAVKGTKEFSAVHAGQTYYFVNQDALEAFEKNPAKYLPEYGGWCAYGMTLGKKFPVDPTVFTVTDGKLYLNKNKSVGKKFDKDTAKYIAKADEEWKKVK